MNAAHLVLIVAGGAPAVLIVIEGISVEVPSTRTRPVPDTPASESLERRHRHREDRR
jgi:hypothetical protein